ncbi:c-type cytochrome [Flavihumibacter fluvii]|uniref:c-type cytochrome n=1 Tax=Flavihumibacter fluvii TaxID=2838157 RepID=UPI001BDDF61F|nr:c-type cytochrome [Flavihumibacter fluvii]ULQ50887.1 c-type cytochrome [Flavihumibacter fluvii]
MLHQFWKPKQFPQLFYSLLLLSIAACTNNAGNSGVVVETGRLPDSIAEGKKMFEATCVRCHGMDGSGLTGPSLKRPKLKHVTDLASFTNVVTMGIAGTGMPGNWAYSNEDCRQLYAYINTIKKQEKEPLKGDPAAGRLVYQNSGCANCHLMYGEGNSIGPELTEIGAIRNTAYLHQAIVDPDATFPESTDPDNGYGFSLYLSVKVATSDGQTITGLRINEDTYTIQLKDTANNYYSFNKDELVSIEKQYGHSVMPSYKTKLSAQEIDNLIAFLHKAGNP